MFVIFLSSLVVKSITTTNFKFDQLVFAIHDSPPHILRSVRMTTHSTPSVTHAHDHWRTLNFANAFVSPGVSSRAELIPSPRAYARNGAGSGNSWRVLSKMKCSSGNLGQIKKHLVSVTHSQIFRGGRFFFNIYSFFNFLIVFLGGCRDGDGFSTMPYRWYFLYWCCEGRHFARRTLYTQNHALLSISI
jgi:hypothetical protein